jgi:membrane-associated phospholipid phosphatase
MVTYFWVGWSRNPATAHELAFAVDGAVPFVASSIWMYLAIFPGALAPLFVVGCPRLFRRTALAYAVVMLVSCVCFLVYPVTSAHLRAPESSGPSGCAVSLLYAADPPYNLFPSLHLSIAGLSAFAVWKTARGPGAIAFGFVAAIGASACTVKQHFVVDAAAGLVLALLVGMFTLASYRPMDGDRAEMPHRRGWAYVGFVVLFYLIVAFVVYLSVNGLCL